MVSWSICSFPHNLIVNSEWVAPASLRPRSGQARRLSGRHLAFPLIFFPWRRMLSTRPTPGPDIHPSPAVPDRGYSSALAAANRFLQAWQNQDHETGLLMLTDVAKQDSSQDRMEVSSLRETMRPTKSRAEGNSKPGAMHSPSRCLRPSPTRASRTVRRDRRSWWFAPAKTNGQSINCPSGHSVSMEDGRSRPSFDGPDGRAEDPLRSIAKVFKRRTSSTPSHLKDRIDIVRRSSEVFHEAHP